MNDKSDNLKPAAKTTRTEARKPLTRKLAPSSVPRQPWFLRGAPV